MNVSRLYESLEQRSVQSLVTYFQATHPNDIFERFMRYDKAQHVSMIAHIQAAIDSNMRIDALKKVALKEFLFDMMSVVSVCTVYYQDPEKLCEHFSSKIVFKRQHKLAKGSCIAMRNQYSMGDCQQWTPLHFVLAACQQGEDKRFDKDSLLISQTFEKLLNRIDQKTITQTAMMQCIDTRNKGATVMCFALYYADNRALQRYCKRLTQETFTQVLSTPMDANSTLFGNHRVPMRFALANRDFHVNDFLFSHLPVLGLLRLLKKDRAYDFKALVTNNKLLDQNQQQELIKKYRALKAFVKWFGYLKRVVEKPAYGTPVRKLQDACRILTQMQGCATAGQKKAAAMDAVRNAPQIKDELMGGLYHNKHGYLRLRNAALQCEITYLGFAFDRCYALFDDFFKEHATLLNSAPEKMTDEQGAKEPKVKKKKTVRFNI